MKLGGKVGSRMHTCWASDERSQHISGALTQVNRIFSTWNVEPCPGRWFLKWFTKIPKWLWCRMQSHLLTQWGIRKKKKKARLCLGLGRTPEILYAALGLKINPSTSTIGQRRFFSEGQPCCAGTRPELLITRLKLVGTLAAPQPPNTLSKSDSSQNEMFFQEMEMKTLAPPLSPAACLSSCLAKYRWAQPLPPPFYYSDTLTHYLFHTLFLPPVLSHLSPLFSPGTSMCFSLIEMHFNVVQISFLQLQSKLATCLRVCVRARLVTRAYSIYTSVCTYVRAFEGERRGEKDSEEAFPQLKVLLLLVCTSSSLMPPSPTNWQF